MSAEDNRKIAEAFAAQFTPALDTVPFQKLNGVPVPNGFTCAWHDKGLGLGVTIQVFGNGHVHAYFEAGGAGEELARRAGKAFAGALRSVS